jgi:hypothetical protein
MPDDTLDQCCAIGLCCDKDKRRVALAKLIAEAAHLDPKQAKHVADYLHDTFDLVPKRLGLGDFLKEYAEMAREHPYE